MSKAGFDDIGGLSNPNDSVILWMCASCPHSPTCVDPSWRSVVLRPYVLSPPPCRWVQAGVSVQEKEEMRLSRDVCSAPPVMQVSHSRWHARSGGHVKDYGTLDLGLGRNMKVTDGSCQK